MNVEKIEKSARAMKVVWGVVTTLFAGVYGFCIYIYQNRLDLHDHTKSIQELRVEINGHKQECVNRFKIYEETHKNLEKGIAQNSSDRMKIEVALTKISTDLQFIKEHLMRKGMDK